MHHILLVVLGLLFAVFMLVMLAQKIRVAYPIFLVIAGLLISIIPGMPLITLDPELIFLIFLPPLLYEAAWYTSWHDFWKWKRPIALLAFGLVFLTSTVVAYLSTSLIPGFTLALGFLLGGIVSPPDAVAAATVLKGMNVPRRIVTILEGESLINDASSLIVFRFAVAAVLTGSFSLTVAAEQFVIVAGLGIVIGLLVGLAMLLIHRYLPTTEPIDAALTLMTPYILFLTAEHFHFSGVMAVVTGGLFMSYHSQKAFQTGSTRMNMLGVWTTLIFVINALVFVLIGLQLPSVVADLGESSIIEGIVYGIIVSIVMIVVRFAWVYPLAHLPRTLFPSIRRSEPSPGWKGPLITGWAGMRGVVSLATALSIPMLMTDGTAFPQRNLIILITFVAIFITLVFQGLTLPFLLRAIRVQEIDSYTPLEEEDLGIMLRLKQAAIKRIDDAYAIELASNSLLQSHRAELELQADDLARELDLDECEEPRVNERQRFNEILVDLCREQRQELHKMRREKAFSDPALRHAEIKVDLDELKVTGTAH